MTRVDFYVLEEADAARHERMICRIVEKAWQQGHAVYVHCADADAARAFDDLLWRFQDVSFVPHVLDGGTDEAPVRIGCTPAGVATPEVLVNLAPAVPAAASSFERVVESAGYDEASRGAARQRYRYYQERGFPLNTHKLGR